MRLMRIRHNMERIHPYRRAPTAPSIRKEVPLNAHIHVLWHKALLLREDAHIVEVFGEAQCSNSASVRAVDEPVPRRARLALYAFSDDTSDNVDL